MPPRAAGVDEEWKMRDAKRERKIKMSGRWGGGESSLGGGVHLTQTNQWKAGAFPIGLVSPSALDQWKRSTSCSTSQASTRTTRTISGWESRGDDHKMNLLRKHCMRESIIGHSCRAIEITMLLIKHCSCSKGMLIWFLTPFFHTATHTLNNT